MNVLQSIPDTEPRLDLANDVKLLLVVDVVPVVYTWQQ